MCFLFFDSLTERSFVFSSSLGFWKVLFCLTSRAFKHFLLGFWLRKFGPPFWVHVFIKFRHGNYLLSNPQANPSHSGVQAASWMFLQGFFAALKFAPGFGVCVQSWLVSEGSNERT